MKGLRADGGKTSRVVDIVGVLLRGRVHCQIIFYYIIVLDLKLIYIWIHSMCQNKVTVPELNFFPYNSKFSQFIACLKHQCFWTFFSTKVSLITFQTYLVWTSSGNCNTCKTLAWFTIVQTVSWVTLPLCQNTT